MTTSGFFNILIAALTTLAAVIFVMIYAYSVTSGGEREGGR